MNPAPGTVNPKLLFVVVVVEGVVGFCLAAPLLAWDKSGGGKTDGLTEGDDAQAARFDKAPASETER